MNGGGRLSHQPRDGGKQIHVVFRMDDYSAVSDTDLELRVLDLFEKKRIGITFGVVPFVCAVYQRDPATQDLIPLPRKKMELLKAKMHAGFLDVALHGYAHQTNDASGEPSEFSGLDYATQVEKFAEGKRFLEEMTGHTVECFIPPWNSYDLNTVRALEEAGFTLLSAGWKGVAAGESNIRFLPATCPLHAIKDAIEAARSARDTQPVIVVLFHLYDFKESGDQRGSISLQEFSDLLDWLATQKDLRLASIRQANEAIVDLSAKRFLALERWRYWERFLPRYFHEKKPVLLYHEVKFLQETLFKLVIFYGILSTSLLLCIYLILSLDLFIRLSNL